MTTEIIKQIQSETAYPDSISVQQALLKVWNECEQEKQQVNSVDLADVVGQSEQLKAFREWWNKDNEGVCTTITNKDIERYLESL